MTEFSDDAWLEITAIRAAIDQLPFLTELSAGTLAQPVFVGYLAQDTFYLNGYSRALARAASLADENEHALFWVESSRQALIVEQELHGAHVSDLSAHTPSPTTTAYLNFLLAQQSYPVLAAALLPCFWLYSDTGERLLAGTELDGHPFADWISAYGSEDFAASTARARQIVDDLAARAGEHTRAGMLDAFVAASRYEWMFWDAAYRCEGWPV